MPKKYHAVIDAGSSGTRLFLYEVTPGLYPQVHLITEIENAEMPDGRREDGINNFIDPANPSLAKEVVPLTIVPLLQQLKKTLEALGVAPDQVMVDLFATAGMRYTERMFGSACVQQFYEGIVQGIGDQGFEPGQVRTSDGEKEEGLWTWINLNDLERDVFRSDAAPFGVVEVGGSSVQLSFPAQPDAAAIGSAQVVSINGRTFNVLCKTYLGLGQDDARKTMRINLAAQAAVCFPEGFLPAHDVGDVLDGVGHYRLSEAGRYQFEHCDAAYEAIINAIHKEHPLPDLTLAGIDFVGTDAVFHATKYWDIEHEPIKLAKMIMAYCRDSGAFPGIETNEFIQAQAANATYIRALLFGQRGLFCRQPARLARALPNKSEGKTRLTWTRGYLLQKYALPNN